MTVTHDQLSISVSPDRMSATLIVPPGCPPEALTVQAIEAVITQHRLCSACLEPDAVGAVRKMAARHPDGGFSVVMATGLSPQTGEHSRLELAPALARGFAARAPGQLVPIVSAGQIIGALVSSTLGVDGTNVYGDVLPARPGSNAIPRLDDSVLLKGTMIIAQRCGLLDTDAGMCRVLSEAELDRIDGPGVNFPGTLRVQGPIGDSACVRVGADLEVRGIIDAASIEVGGNARLARGIAGRGIGRLEVGRSLTAHYLSHVSASIGGDLTLEHEAASSTLSVIGRCLSPQASLIGGTLTIGGSCELLEVGSESWAVTTIVLGRFAKYDRLLASALIAIQRLRNDADKAREQVSALQAAGPRLTHEQAEAMTEQVCRHDQADLELRRTLDSAAQLCDAYRRRRVTRLLVHRRVHAGTRIVAGDHQLTIRATIQGPLEFSLNADGTPRIVDISTRTPITPGGCEVEPTNSFSELRHLEHELRSQIRSAAA